MDDAFLELYGRELKFLRGMGAEFAEQNKKIAGRLGLSDVECADPYVERLLEGFAFLAARVHLKLDAEFPRFTRHLLELVYPHYLAPTPSMAVVRIQAEATNTTLGGGYIVPRQTALRSGLSGGTQTTCEFRTAHDVTLWPIEVAEAEYMTSLRDVAEAGSAVLKGAKAAIRIRLKAKQGWTFDKLPLDSLAFFLSGAGETPFRLHEQLLANALAVVMRPSTRPAPWTEAAPRGAVRRCGFADEQALLPYGPRSFQGYRLLQEYFALPERFLFVEIFGLARAVKRCKEPELELFVVLDRNETALHNAVTKDSFALFCTPAINLFTKQADSAIISKQAFEHQVVADRTRPIDFEVFHVRRVVGTAGAGGAEIEFRPFYSRREVDTRGAHGAYFTVRRDPRLLSEKERLQGPRSKYLGSEVFLSVVDADEAPFSTELTHLAVETLCTNRDLPLLMTTGVGKTDFTLQTGAPVTSISCVAGPTPPRGSAVHGESAWRLIGHLSLNYLSLAVADQTGTESARALREMLSLYAGPAHSALQRQIEGVAQLRTAPIIRRIHDAGMTSLGRGIELTLNFDESAFAGSSPFTLGTVLEEFFARYVSINSFTETVVGTLDRGELIRWPARTGRRQIL